jgi:UDP-2,3-diacylglucosamine hydrolase
MAKPHFIASDVHLGAVPRTTEQAFVSFLEHVGAEGSALLIAGDLFDFWFEYGEIVHGKHFRVLGALARLVEAGIPVTLAGGNHDAWGGPFLRDEVGVVFHRDPFRTTIAARPALVAHGDGLGTGDVKYRVLKRVLRSPLTVGAFRALHPELGLRVARAVSKTHDHAACGDSRGRSGFLERWARARLAEDASLRIVVCGHSHEAARVEVEPERWYLNAGEWLRSCTYYRVAEDAAPELLRWPDGAAAQRSTSVR